jgi:hypothetical protein
MNIKKLLKAIGLSILISIGLVLLIVGFILIQHYNPKILLVILLLVVFFAIVESVYKDIL